MPREVALERHDHIDQDLQDRCEQWSRLGKCPRGLAETSHAFQHGGFGTHELVEYYELVRDLLWSCWDQLTEMEQSPEVGHRSLLLTVGDFLTTEVPRLESVREAWLDTPDPEFHGRTPRSIIARERARLPEAVFGKDAVIDPDCSCCQMMAELPGPTFWHLDGCNMDDEFAFNIHCKTREDWEKEQSDWEDFNRRFEAESADAPAPLTEALVDPVIGHFAATLDSTASDYPHLAARCEALEKNLKGCWSPLARNRSGIVRTRDSVLTRVMHPWN